MNIKRFVATDMREALRAVRAELGADAVMLSSRGVDGGVEVVAAVDYDDGLLAAVGDAFTGTSAPGPADAPARPGADAAAGLSGAAAAAARANPLAEYQRIATTVDDAATDDPLWDDDNGAPAAAPAPAPASVHAPTPKLAATLAPIHAPLPPRAAEPAARATPAVRAAVEAPAVRAAAEEPDTVRLRQELKDMRELLETQLASLAWNDLNRRVPARARVLRQLTAIGIDAALARELTDGIKPTDASRDAWRLPLRLLADRLPLAAHDPAAAGGVYAFVGPTGVGKTTTIAKIAARYVMKHGADSIALVTTDTYRIGARDQLLTFARILGTPMHSVRDAAELGRVLEGLGDKKLVLIDTAGMSQRDVRLAEQFSTLRVDRAQVRSVLVLSAATERGALEEALALFRAAEPTALALTKIDEAALLGPLLSMTIASGLPVAYVADGQRVPEDLHIAGGKRLWLVQAAVRCSRNRPSQLAEEDLAERFGTLELAERPAAAELAGA